MSTYPPTEPLSPSSSSSTYDPPVPVTIAVIYLVSFLFGFFTINFCKCILDNLTTNGNDSSSSNNREAIPSDDHVVAAPFDEPNKTNGLDPELVQTFPTFYYSNIKEFRREKYGLECAICLGEFVDDDLLRFLTICCHVFHKECVDLWLESNKTCPVCRRELDVPRKSIERSSVLLHSNSMGEMGANDRCQNPFQNDVCIEIKENSKERVDDAQSSSSNTTEKHRRKREGMERFFRSNSTGHSITRIREEDDSKYTLRLLDNVKIRILWGHKAASSCVSFRDFSSPLNYSTSVASNESLGGDIDKV